jgi:dTDP-glucose 4,6-dehydratase
MAPDTNVVVTGGAGFIGSHLVDALLERPSTTVTVLDRLSTGGSRANLEAHIGDPRLRFVLADVADAELVDELVAGANAVIHAAAESHVDRSIDDPGAFLRTNVIGTQAVLEASRRHDVRMLMVSTDEVYGPGDPDDSVFDEEHPLRPASPYAASKAAADLLCSAYVTTYGAPVTIVRGTNAFGPRQIERAVPTFSICALEGRSVPVYGEGRQRREFLYVSDWIGAALRVLDDGAPGEIYNIGGGYELENLELARRICTLVGVPESQISFVTDRPGHDFRYGLRSARLLGLGWEPQVTFDDGLARTVQWYRDHLTWLRQAHDVPVVTEPRGAGAGL